MPDEMDYVQEQVALQNAPALEEQLRHRPTGASLKNCAVCGEEIPEARRQALPGVAKCYSCQLEYELMHGRGM